MSWLNPFDLRCVLLAAILPFAAPGGLRSSFGLQPNCECSS